jgi:hypothetical protein
MGPSECVYFSPTGFPTPKRLSPFRHHAEYADWPFVRSLSAKFSLERFVPFARMAMLRPET